MTNRPNSQITANEIKFDLYYKLHTNKKN